MLNRNHLRGLGRVFDLMPARRRHRLSPSLGRSPTRLPANDLARIGEDFRRVMIRQLYETGLVTESRTLATYDEIMQVLEQVRMGRLGTQDD